MPNELAATAAAPQGRRTSVGADDLARGLLLVRASAIKVVRFQLAMERQDRRLALQTVDDLVLLDRKIENFLSDMPSVGDGVSALERELEAQRQALAREKFTLAAGTERGPSAGDNPDACVEAGEGSSPSEPELLLAEPAEVAPVGGFLAGESSRLIATGLLLVLAALACALLFFLANSGTPLSQGAVR